jgi:predicted amidophosphoribosyltransferase
VFTEASGRTSAPASAARALAGFFFPSRCLACRWRPLDRLFRGGVCEPCWSEVETPGDARCAACDEATAADAEPLCGRCLLDPPAFSRLRAAAPYRGAAREILLAFKFRGADFLAPHLADLLCARLALARDVAEVAAVPATRRARRRADHAAELLARAVARRLRRPVAAGRLVKVRETERQSGLPLARRDRNVRGAFRATGARGPVLLVDDVVTSGATARECARRLRSAGAPDVQVWCFARAERPEARWEPPEGMDGAPGGLETTGLEVASGPAPGSGALRNGI